MYPILTYRKNNYLKRFQVQKVHLIDYIHTPKFDFCVAQNNLKIRI